MIGQAPRERGVLTILSDGRMVLSLPSGTNPDLVKAMRQHLTEWSTDPTLAGTPATFPGPIDVDDQRPVRVNEYAGHRVPDEHECFLMNCSGLGAEVIALRDMIAEYIDGGRVLSPSYPRVRAE